MTNEFFYYDLRLVEESVFAALKDRPEAGSFHAARASIYDLVSVEARDREFDRLYRDWFRRLGFSAIIEGVLAEQPTLFSQVKSCVVLRAVGKKQEGAELLVNADNRLGDRERRTLRLLLRPESLLHRASLVTYLRHELFHIVDMLDPAFAYQPALPAAEGGPAHDALLRERYKTLWDTWIVGRMIKRGWLEPDSRAQQFAVFRLSFPMLSEHTEDVFNRFFDAECHKHAEFVEFAQNPHAIAGAAARSCQRGWRCPLCGFPTHAFEDGPEKMDEAVVTAIRQDFPRLRATDGICIQCADLYRVSQQSMTAARQLPGWR